MAGRANVLLRGLSAYVLRSSPRNTLGRSLNTATGGIEDKPIKYYNMGLIRLALVIIPFTYVGYWAGGQFAEFLEENEFYIPDEDEDD
jgi:hypothetical protein